MARQAWTPSGVVIAAFLSGIACSAASANPAPAPPAIFGFGEAATSEEIAVLDRDVRPDGAGLPEGAGSAAEGALIYAIRCAACHGVEGRGGPFDELVGEREFPSSDDPTSFTRRTIGNWWPYATTLFDYVQRAMPTTAPGSLQADEVYALTAHLLHLNGIVPADAVLSHDTLADVVMPARDRFVPDDRAGGEEIR